MAGALFDDADQQAAGGVDDEAVAGETQDAGVLELLEGAALGCEDRRILAMARGNGEETLAPRQNRVKDSSRIPWVGPRAAAVPSAQSERPQPSSVPGWSCHWRS